MTLDWLMGIAGFLLIVSIFANRISDRFGIPGLLLFLGIGMLAGTDGVGKIQFSNARLSNYIGTVALTFILFSGGLETKWKTRCRARFRTVHGRRVPDRLFPVCLRLLSYRPLL